METTTTARATTTATGTTRSPRTTTTAAPATKIATTTTTTTATRKSVISNGSWNPRLYFRTLFHFISSLFLFSAHQKNAALRQKQLIRSFNRRKGAKELLEKCLSSSSFTSVLFTSVLLQQCFRSSSKKATKCSNHLIGTISLQSWFQYSIALNVDIVSTSKAFL